MRKFALHTFALVLLAILSLPVIASDTNGTSLQDYAVMHSETQRQLIKDATSALIEKTRNKNPQQVLCVANLFHETDKGVEEWSYMKEALRIAIQKQYPQSVERIVEIIITNKFCPIEAGTSK